VAAGQRAHLTIHGADYQTPDGTCIRDFVHVSDLAGAHLLALEFLAGGGEPDTFNVGVGEGFSVTEVIAAAEGVTGRPVPAAVAGRRPGDPDILVADAARIRTILGWRPRHSDLTTIVGDAWRFHARRFGAGRCEPLEAVR